MGWRHWFRVGGLTRDERENDLDHEIRAHLELEAEEHQGAGMTAQDAHDAAQRAFGNRTLVSEDIRATWGTRGWTHSSRTSAMPCA